MPFARLSYSTCAGLLLFASFATPQSDPAATPPSNSQPSAAPNPSSPPPDNADLTAPIARGEVREVIAPVTVLDRSGGFVDGIEPGRFHLYDNGKPQNIHVDIAVQPISLVVAVQQSDRVDAVLTQVHKIGPMIQPLVSGDNGEAAIISFDSRIQVKTDFTNDPNKIDRAINSIHAGTTPSRMIDAVERGVQMLRTREGHRRIILLISETRDVSSEARLRETMIGAQLANVTIYSVDISRMVTSLTSKPQPPRPDPQPPAAYNLPGPYPDSPWSIQQKTMAGSRVEFVPLLKEIYLGTKRIFVDNPVEVLTQSTGGEQFSFKRQRALEEAIEDIGREIHNQYLISYSPNNRDEGGFHQIRVDVDLPDLVVRTRPGYYIASVNGK
jgi:VWFA-related protein